MDIRPIRGREDHTATLREIESIWGAAEKSPEGYRLDVLLALVESWESRTLQEPPALDPVCVIRFIMAENDYTQTDLADVLGSRSSASAPSLGSRSGPG